MNKDKFSEVKKFIKQECKENNVRFFHGRGKTVSFQGESVRSNGYFNEPLKKGDKAVLAISTNPNSLDVLIHEYCHMQQYLEGHPYWKALNGKGHMWQWLDGQKVPHTKVVASVEAHYNIEVDCEARAVKMHRKFKTGINLTEYIQKANAYTMFYFYVLENRKWYAPGREPYNLKEVWSKLPKTFAFNREKWYNKHKKIFENCV